VRLSCGALGTARRTHVALRGVSHRVFHGGAGLSAQGAVRDDSSAPTCTERAESIDDEADDDDDDSDNDDDDDDIDVDALEAEMRAYNSFFARRHDESVLAVSQATTSLSVFVPFATFLCCHGYIKSSSSPSSSCRSPTLSFPFDLASRAPVWHDSSVSSTTFIVVALLLVALGLIVRSLWTGAQRPQQQARR
jgi:hypothetical protein